MKFSSALKLNHIFRRLYGTPGTSNRFLALYARKNRTGQNRVGITVSKKLGGAVVRNRVRRRLREIYRLSEDLFIPGYDIVVVARSYAVEASFEELRTAYLSAAKKAGILSAEAQQ
ncbi:MAG: ribonuclease P protein component [Oscillospiraceae bacterium]|nr:ribonuclease P protein component [Oscillospiraceae bacterium]